MYGKYPSICSVSCIHSYIDISAWLFSPEFVSRQLHIMTPCRSMNKTTTGTAYERLTARNLMVVSSTFYINLCLPRSFGGKWSNLPTARDFYPIWVETKRLNDPPIWWWHSSIVLFICLEDSLIFAYWRWVKGSLNWLSQDPKHVSIWPGDWFRMDNECIHFNLQGSVLSL